MIAPGPARGRRRFNLVRYKTRHDGGGGERNKAAGKPLPAPAQAGCRQSRHKDGREGNAGPHASKMDGRKPPTVGGAQPLKDERRGENQNKGAGHAANEAQR